jgi:histidine kinase
MLRNTRFLPRLTLKNKILFSSLAVILAVSVCIALVARYILISSLTKELETRGLGIAHSIADRSKSLMLTQDSANLISLVFEAAQVGERRNLVAYIYILDEQNRVMASTFIHPFPESLRTANIIPPGQKHSVKLSSFRSEAAYDVAVPIKEGIYDIGSVHVGLSKKHIDNIIAKLRLAFLSFISVIVIIMFFISEKLSRNITRPIGRLITMANEISRDNLDFSMEFSHRKGCWELVDCTHKDCPAYGKREVPCWSLEGTRCENCDDTKFPDKLSSCEQCEVYKLRGGDEVIQLADAFNNMVRHIKEYRSQLKKSQQKYRSLFHSGPDPIFVLDCRTHEVLDANPMAVEVYGYARKDLVGKPFSHLGPEFTEACLSTFSAQDSEAMAGCVFYPKVLHYKKGNKPFYVNVHACGTNYEDRPAIIVSATDITDMIEMDAQIIQASKMKTLGEMSAGMAHELNQPLNAIKIGSEFLNLMSEKGEYASDKMHRVVSEISVQVDRAAEIINTLRAFGRKSDMSRERLDLNKPVKNVLSIIGQQLKLENISIRLDLGQNLPFIQAHSNRLEQVLFNLVTNARDAINMQEEGGRGERSITIQTFARNGRVSVSVCDTGAGMPDSVRNKIFEPFFTTKETGKGMGLGLAISYGIVKDYQGEINVSSEEGTGTTFTLSFPVSA